MKNAKNIFTKTFWVWFVGAVILSGMMVIFQAPNAKWMAATIMAGFMVLPVRDWMYRLLVWAIDFVSSINTDFKDRINPYATYNRLVDPAKREENVGFYRTLKGCVYWACVILALICLWWQGASFNLVYGYLHTIEMLVTLQLHPLALLIAIGLIIGFYYGAYRFTLRLLREDFINPTTSRLDVIGNWPHFAGMLLLFIAKIFGAGLCIKLPWNVMWTHLILWILAIGIPVAIIWIRHFIHHRRKA